MKYSRSFTLFCSLMIGVDLGTTLFAETAQSEVGEKAASQLAAIGKCQLLLPKVIYAAPGLETNIYFRNVVLDPIADPYLFDVESRVGTQESGRWTWVPTQEDVGDHPIKIEVRDFDDQVVATGETLVHVAQSDSGSKTQIKVLCIGDSLTAASVYTEELLKLGSGEKNPNIILLGTTGLKENPKNLHEGYGGWKYQTFIEKWVPDADAAAPKKLQSSPFLFLENGKPSLDFSRYLKERLNGERPDYVAIMLGTNDVFGATDQTRQQSTETMIDSAKTLVSAIRKALPDIPIGVVPPIPPSISQDAFGANYESGQTRWTYRKNQHEAVLQLMKTFGNRESENLFIIPAYTNLDCEHNYPSQKVAVNARNPAVISRPSNGVHPGVPGYLQIGNSIFSWIKSQAKKN